MDWQYLFKRQSELDAYIKDNKGLNEANLFDMKILALYVELGELANETRTFKFWSQKKASDKSIIIEEYVDNIHFLMSLGLEKGFEFEKLTSSKPETNSLTEHFNHLYEQISFFQREQTKEAYLDLVKLYLQLARLLGYTRAEIQAAYDEKNKENFNRQDSGY